MWNYYVTCLKKYVDFSGRATRSEYWYFCLMNFLICLCLGVLGAATLYSLYLLFVLIPGIAVFVRRMHDINKSGWNFLWGLIPIVGPVIVLVLACLPTKTGANKYVK